MEQYKEEIKKYGMLHEYHDSEELLMKSPHLACEDSANYLVVWCIDLEVEEVTYTCTVLASIFYSVL